MSTTQPKKNNLKLADIDPAKDERYSLNLFKFLSRNKFQCQLSHVYQEKDGDLILGWWDEGYFIGNALQHILTGVSKQPFSYSHKRRYLVKEVHDFWTKYTKIGVCAIDELHQWYDGRWTYESKVKRACQWCGCQQSLKKKVVRTTKSWWVNSSQ